VFKKDTPVLDQVTEQTSVIILGGGRGHRLYPLTKERAKPAVPMAGKFRLIDLPMSNCLHSNLDKIYLLTQFNSDSLHRHISQTYRFDAFSSGFVQILAAQQTPANMNWYQGTADAVRHALRRFVNRRPDQVLILSGDHLYRMDYRPLLKAHQDHRADVTIAVLPVAREQCKEFGILQIDAEEKIISFVEKPHKDEDLDRLRVPKQLFEDHGIVAQGREHIASMGVYAFRTEALFQALRNHPESDFGKDIIPLLLNEMNVYAYFFDGYWEDIGTISTFYQANLALTHIKPQFNFYDEGWMIYSRPRFLPGTKINEANIRSSVICDGAIVSGAVVKESIVGLRSAIEHQAQVIRTIMMGADYYDTHGERFEEVPPGAPPLGIGPRSIVQGAIVDKNARIGADVRIINERRVKDEDGPNYCIRDGIIVIPRSAVIPNGTVI